MENKYLRTESSSNDFLGEPSPLLASLARRGVCGIKKMARSDLSAADGVVVQVQKNLSILNHHPVRSIKGSYAIFFLMSRPPLIGIKVHLILWLFQPPGLWEMWESRAVLARLFQASCGESASFADFHRCGIFHRPFSF